MHHILHHIAKVRQYLIICFLFSITCLQCFSSSFSKKVQLLSRVKDAQKQHENIENSNPTEFFIL